MERGLQGAKSVAVAVLYSKALGKLLKATTAESLMMFDVPRVPLPELSSSWVVCQQCFHATSVRYFQV